MPRRTVLLVEWLALVVAVSVLTVASMAANGSPTHDAELHDSGIWVTNQQWGGLGRQNRPVAQLDAVVWADARGRRQPHGGLDVLQNGAAVIAVDSAGRTVTPVDTRLAARIPDAAVPVEDGRVVLGGDVAGLVEERTGKVWLSRLDTAEGVTDLSGLDAASEPVTTIGRDATLTIGVDGTAHAVSRRDLTATTIRPTGRGFSETQPTALDPRPVGAITQVTTAGGRLVHLDATGTLGVAGIAADVGEDAVLQQPGPSAEEVVVASPGGLHVVEAASAAVTTIAEAAGAPIAPVRLGDCVFGAWAAGTSATVVSSCGDGEPRTGAIDDLPTDAELVFRVNRGQLVLNDVRSGTVWEVEGSVVEQISNWNAFAPQSTDEDQEKNKESTAVESAPRPRAEDDTLGARAGRTSVLHVLDNDSAATGSVLSIVSASPPTTPGVTVAVAPDGQSLLATVAETAAGRSVSFDYTVDDGTGGKRGRDDATVTLAARDDRGSGTPTLRAHFRPTPHAVAAGGMVEIPVAGDWRDPEYGDPVALDRVRTSAGAASVSPEGMLRYTADDRSGVHTVEYDVSTGGARASGKVTVNVVAGNDTAPPRPEDDVAQGAQGSWITLRPLDNDLPGADPSDLDARLTLAGDVAPSGGLEVQTDRETGVVRVRGRAAGTRTLTYTAGFAAARPRTARIRVDITSPGEAGNAPVAAPDAAVVFGTASRTVDVLANDRDPLGRLLAITLVDQGAEDAPLRVAVIDGRWLRVTATEPHAQQATHTVTYRVSNGDAEATGALTVTRRPALSGASNAPVTSDDDVTVRAGDSVSVPVLHNDSTPSGDPVGLVVDETVRHRGRLQVLGQRAVGEAYLDGNRVRFVAPSRVDGPTDVDVRYLVQNTGDPTAERSSGTLRVHITPRGRPEDNRAPTPRALEVRVVRGGRVVVTVPTIGADPDGDSVTITSLGSRLAPSLGRVVSHSGRGFTYRSFPHATGTDEFDYEVTDALGARATGTVRVAVMPQKEPQRPVAVDDLVTLDPTRTLTYDVLANDIVPQRTGSVVELGEGAPDGVSVDGDTGLLTVAPRPRQGTVRVPYRVRSGLADDVGELVIRYQPGFDNPPRALPADASPVAGSTDVEVDLSDRINDIDDARSDLTVDRVHRSGHRGTTPQVTGGTVTLPVSDVPTIWTYRVTDPDGAQSVATISVPARPSGAPYLRPDALVTLPPGETRAVDLTELVIDPEGDPVALTTDDRITTAPAGLVTVGETTAGTMELTAGRRAGLAVLTFEVTDRPDLSDPEAHAVLLSVPVQIGDVAPELICPTTPLQVPAGSSHTIDVDGICQVWTPDPAGARRLSFRAETGRELAGVTARADGPRLSIDAGDAVGGTRGTIALQVRSHPEVSATLVVLVTGAEAPTLGPITPFRVAPGDSLPVDLAAYLRTPLPADERDVAVTAAEPMAGAPDVARASGSQVTLDIPESAQGRLRYHVEVSDSGASSGRPRATGTIVVDVASVPGAPTRLRAGPDFLSNVVALSWRAPRDNGGEPIRYYEVRLGDAVRRCPTTSCRITGLENGRDYDVRVRAVNSVGPSEAWSNSVTVRPDAYTGPVRNLRVTLQRDRQVTLAWSRPAACDCSSVRKYRITWPGSGIRTVSGTATTYPARIAGNGQPVRFTVVPLNDKGLRTGRGPTASVVGMGAGAPPAPGRPRLSWSDRSDNSAKVVTISWPSVAPNGPGPTTYSVRRRGGGTTTTVCRWNATRTCRDQLVNDGRTYTYTVRARNAEAHSANERRAGGGGLHVSTWSAPAVIEAAAQPDPVRITRFRPTGKDGTARVDFDVGASHGRSNAVRCTVNGASCGTWTFPVGGMRGVTRTLSGLPDGRTSTVRLVACNGSSGGHGAGAACSTGSSASTVTFGPIGRVTISAGRESRTSTRWRASVDPNGKAVRIVVRLDGATVWSGTSGTGPWSSSGVDAVGSSHTSRYRIVVRDTSGSSRPERSATATATTPAPEPRITEVYKAGSCTASTCPSAGSGTIPCSGTCWYIGVEAVDFAAPSTCHRVVRGVGRVGTTDTVRNGRQRFSTSWSGSGITFRIECNNGATSAWVSW